MDNKLNMQDIIDLLVVKNDINKEEADKFIVELFSLIEKGLTNDEIAKIKDFGSFKLTHIQERESIDVNTKEKIVIPAHRRVSFVPAPILKTLVNKPFAHFDTTPLNEGVFADGIPQDAQSDIERYEDTEDDDEVTDNENSVEDATANEDTPIEYKPSDSESQKSAVGASIANSSYNSKSKKSYRRYIIVGAIVSLLIITVAYIHSHYLPASLVKRPNNSATTASQKEINVEKAELASNTSPNILDTAQLVAPLTRKTAKMSPGRTLRLIALDKLGNKEFWVYIYLVNESKIENPNVVPVGLVLDLPHKDEFPMNANNPDEVMKAKELGDELMDRFSN